MRGTITTVPRLDAAARLHRVEETGSSPLEVRLEFEDATSQFLQRGAPRVSLLLQLARGVEKHVWRRYYSKIAFKALECIKYGGHY